MAEALMKLATVGNRRARWAGRGVRMEEEQEASGVGLSRRRTTFPVDDNISLPAAACIGAT